jgi:hypothetical protein
VHRDFSILLEQCDHDLDQALAAREARQDYSVLERTRDLAGAVRRNAFPARG